MQTDAVLLEQAGLGLSSVTRTSLVLTVRLGLNEILVVSISKMAKECLTVHDKVFSSRPTITASKIMGYNFAMFGFAPYGTYWREMRKTVTVEL